MGKLLLVAGASGAGKTTLIREALRAYPDTVRYLQTFTTRPRRPDIDEPEYVFVSFSQYEEVRRTSSNWDHGEYYGHYYGCDVESANQLLSGGISLISAVRPDIADIESMRHRYNAATLVVLIRSTEAVRRERLLARGVIEELGRLSIDHDLAECVERMADAVFQPSGDLHEDGGAFSRLIGELIVCAE